MQRSRLTLMTALLLISIFSPMGSALVEPTATPDTDKDPVAPFEFTGRAPVTRSGELVRSLEFPQPRIYSTGDGLRIRVEGLDNDGAPRAMALPRASYSYKLPVGSILEDVRLEVLEECRLPLDGQILRNPAAIPNGDINGWKPDPTPVPGPTEHIYWSVGTGLDIDSRETVAYVNVWIYPSVVEGPGLHHINAAELVIRYSYFETPSPAPFSGEPEEYELLIIAPEEFSDELADYIEYREMIGIPTVLVTIENITNGTIWPAWGNDTQEMIKWFIYQARLNWSVDFVLLAGDEGMVPSRHVMALDGYDDDLENGRQDGRFLPSDLYYGDLFEHGTYDFCDWNDHKEDGFDQIYGEYTGLNADGADMIPDVLVGRLPASDGQELGRMLEKIENYEMTAKGSDWFHNATLCGTDTFTYSGHGDTSGIPEGENLSDHIAGLYLTGFNLTRHYQTEGTLPGIQATVNRGCGFLLMSDHGMYNNWGGTYGSSAAMGQTNGYELPVAVLDACLTHGFDNENASSSVTGRDPIYDIWYYPPGSSQAGRDCLGEKFHQNPDGGAIASYGCTRVGYGGHGTYHRYYASGYMAIHLFKAYSDGYSRSGELLGKSVIDYMADLGITTPGRGAIDYKTLTEYVLLGDPSLSIGGINTTNADFYLDDNDLSGVPGEVLRVNYTVNNTGILDALFLLEDELLDISGLDWNVTVEPNQLLVPPGEELGGYVEITIPEKSLAYTTETIEITLLSDLMRREKKRSIRIDVERTWGVDVEPDDPSLDVDPGFIAWGYVDMENLGNYRENLRTLISDIPEGWNATFENLNSTLLHHIDAYESDQIPFRVEAPGTALAGVYTLNLTSRSIDTPAEDSYNFTVRVGRTYGLDLLLQRRNFEAMPEEVTGVEMTAVNLGNADSNVTVNISSTSMAGWEISLSRDHLLLPPHSSSNLSAEIRAPNGTLAGLYTLTLTIDDGNTSSEREVDITILPDRHFTLICLDGSEIIPSSGPVSFMLEVTNLGNAEDRYVISRSSALPLGWVDEITPESSRLGPGEKKSVRVDISADAAGNGSYHFRYMAAPVSGGGPQYVDITVIIQRSYNFSLSKLEDLSGGYPGSTIEGRFRLINHANCIDGFDLLVSIPDGFAVNTPELPLSLEMGASVWVNLSISIPEDQLAGRYPISARVISTGSLDENSIEGYFNVMEVYDLDLSVEGENGSVSVGPGEMVPLVLHLVNRGNTLDWIRLSILAPDEIMGWFVIGDNSLQLDPGEERNVTIQIKAPRNASSQSYIFVIEVKNANGGKVNREVRLEVGPDPLGDGGKSMDAMIIAVPVFVLIALAAAIVGIFLYVRGRDAGKEVSEVGLEWEE